MQLSIMRATFTSLGHAGGLYNANLRANALAHATSDAAGALWVMEHARIDGAGTGPVFAMQRRNPDADPSHASWCYFVAESDGTLLRSGVLSDCTGCHAASASELFLP